jgi:Rne/Rng family ribonuclease
VGNPPKLLHRETSLTRGIIRDLFSTKVDRLTVDSKQVYNEIVEYLQGIAPELIERVNLYEDKIPLFDKEGVETEIRDLFKRRCELPSGGYLIIEPTEALVSIDVNSGRFTGKKDPEKTVTKTNVEAARRSRGSSASEMSAASSSATSSTWRRRRTGIACCRSCARTWAAIARARRPSR